MTFENLQAMKKRCDFYFKDCGRNMLVSSADAVNLVKASGVSDLDYSVPAETLAAIISGKINSCLALYPCSYDVNSFDFSVSGRKYFVDFECDKTCVYSRTSGKQIYQLLTVRALRLSSFHPDCSFRSLPDFSETFGRWAVGSRASAEMFI